MKNKSKILLEWRETGWFYEGKPVEVKVRLIVNPAEPTETVKEIKNFLQTYDLLEG